MTNEDKIKHLREGIDHAEARIVSHVMSCSAISVLYLVDLKNFIIKAKTQLMALEG